MDGACRIVHAVSCCLPLPESVAVPALPWLIGVSSAVIHWAPSLELVRQIDIREFRGETYNENSLSAYITLEGMQLCSRGPNHLAVRLPKHESEAFYPYVHADEIMRGSLYTESKQVVYENFKISWFPNTEDTFMCDQDVIFQG